MKRTKSGSISTFGSYIFNLWDQIYFVTFVNKIVIKTMFGKVQSLKVITDSVIKQHSISN